MKKLLVLITLGIMALGHLRSQSIWREHPESVKVFKRLHNQWITDYYAYEVEMIKEGVYVVDNRTLVLNLRCPSRSLQFRSDTKVSRLESWHNEKLVSNRPIENRWFFPGENIYVSYDLSPLSLNGHYYFTFGFNTDQGEIYYVNVTLLKDKLPKETLLGHIDRFGPYKQEKQKDENFIYFYVENLAQYPGGNEELIRYLKENVRLPKSHMKGVVEVGMVIDKDGSILYPEVVSSTVPKLDEEALRLVKAMPKWKPASIGKDKVKLRVGVRICFKNLDNSWCFIDDEDLCFSSY